MKKIEEDVELETSPEAKALGWKRISNEHRPKLKKPATLRECKSRITIFLDADIVEHYKEQAGENGKGYQTLINQTLRKTVDEKRQAEKTADIKKEILKDTEFLQELKEALTI